MLNAIAHATDLSPASQAAFLHALRLALEFRCGLDLLHVRPPGAADEWASFPHVREALARWGVMPVDAPVAEIATRTGVTVRKVEIRDAHPVEGIVRFLMNHRPSLMVMATHGRDGLNRWLLGSVSSEVANESRVPSLFLGPNARPFIDYETGGMALERVLFPIAEKPSPRRALHMLETLFDPLALKVQLVHVGERAPRLADADGETRPVEFLSGPVVEAIASAAASYDADILAMPTEGEHGFFDALRGSTTERVLHDAPCPLLALPA